LAAHQLGLQTASQHIHFYDKISRRLALLHREEIECPVFLTTVRKAEEIENQDHAAGRIHR